MVWSYNFLLSLHRGWRKGGRDTLVGRHREPLCACLELLSAGLASKTGPPVVTPGMGLPDLPPSRPLWRPSGTPESYVWHHTSCTSASSFWLQPASGKAVSDFRVAKPNGEFWSPSFWSSEQPWHLITPPFWKTLLYFCFRDAILSWFSSLSCGWSLLTSECVTHLLNFGASQHLVPKSPLSFFTVYSLPRKLLLPVVTTCLPVTPKFISVNRAFPGVPDLQPAARSTARGHLGSSEF